MKKKRTFLGKAPNPSQFSEIARVDYDKSTWVIFHKPGKDWQGLKVVLLNGRRLKANFAVAWSVFRQDFADCHDLTILVEHDPLLLAMLKKLAAEHFPSEYQGEKT